MNNSNQEHFIDWVEWIAGRMWKLFEASVTVVDWNKTIGKGKVLFTNIIQCPSANAVFFIKRRDGGGLWECVVKKNPALLAAHKNISIATNLPCHAGSRWASFPLFCLVHKIMKMFKLERVFRNEELLYPDKLLHLVSQLVLAKTAAHAIEMGLHLQHTVTSEKISPSATFFRGKKEEENVAAADVSSPMKTIELRICPVIHGRPKQGYCSAVVLCFAVQTRSRIISSNDSEARPLPIDDEMCQCGCRLSAYHLTHLKSQACNKVILSPYTELFHLGIPAISNEIAKWAARQGSLIQYLYVENENIFYFDPHCLKAGLQICTATRSSGKNLIQVLDDHFIRCISPHLMEMSSFVTNSTRLAFNLNNDNFSHFDKLKRACQVPSHLTKRRTVFAWGADSQSCYKTLLSSLEKV